MVGKYKIPKNMPLDMGGIGSSIDRRMRGILDLLDYAPLDTVSNVLDIGIGRGQVAIHLSKKGKRVVGTGLELSSYAVESKRLAAVYGITTVACRVEEMPFSDGRFDCVVASHVLEHCPSVGLALTGIHRVLSDRGLLLAFVPPHTNFVAAGHVSMGWNVGQLIYTLLLAGFDVRHGQFIEWQGSVCGFVRKADFHLPPLRGDRGDISILQEHSLLPLPVRTADGFSDGFWGRLGAVNWPERSKMLADPRIRLLRLLAVWLPGSWRVWLARALTHALNYAVSSTTVNPQHLQG